MNAILSHKPILNIGNFQLEWKRNKNKVRCTISLFEENGIKPIESWIGRSVCKHGDKFDMVFGMRQSMANVFKNHDFSREDRTDFYITFDNAYGRGKCLPKEEINFVWTNGPTDLI